MDIENTQQESSDTTSEGGEPTRDDLIAAAREAVAAADGNAATTTQTAAAPTEQQPDPTEERINSVLRAREAAHKQRLEAENHAATLRQQAEEERKRILDEARAEAKRIADEELSQLRAKYRESPTAALRSLADNPQDVVDAVLREGTPEARALARAQEEARQAREEARAGKSAAEELKAELQKDRAERANAAAAAVRTEFLSQFANTEKAPYMNARWDPEEVFDRCDSLCREWQKDGLKLGIDFDRGDLVAYLEKQSRERITKLPGQTPAQQSGAGTPVRESGIAPKSAANGMRTITAASSSERRASPKPFHEMSPEEQREDLINVAREAYRQHGKA